MSQKEVAFTSAAIGISPFMDVQVGTVIPLLFTNEPVAIVGAKVAVPLTPTVRVGGGAQVLANLEYPITLPFVVATVGTEARNVSVTAGSFGASTDPQDRVTLYNVAAMVRMRDNLSILSENYFVSEAGYPFYIPSGGARFHGRSFAADVGFFMPFSPYESGFIPIPWLDLTWNFDLRKP